MKKEIEFEFCTDEHDSLTARAYMDAGQRGTYDCPEVDASVEVIEFFTPDGQEIEVEKSDYARAEEAAFEAWVEYLADARDYYDED